ncbi:MAG TPA: hypothetical protein VHF22_05895 [Planctomycetota bacterium]|nr:hypothetical protein [Planctomycetota bacterium]
MSVHVVRIRRMPEEVRRLRAPWPYLWREVPHLTAELEREFRFGQRVALTERGYILGGTIKGGSSSMWIPASAETYEAYLRWKTIDGFIEDGDPADYEDLRTLLRLFEIELVNARSHGPPEERTRFRRGLGALYPMVLGILKELPPSHLERPELRRIQLGGWGPDAAKGSAYHEGTVYLYDFAVRGARRTCLGLFLHELGHAHEHALAEAQREDLRAIHHRLAAASCFLGIEYLLDPASRVSYQRMAFQEFLAETYLLYTACGGALRDFIEAQPAELREAWRHAYSIFRTTFDHFEYE